MKRAWLTGCIVLLAATAVQAAGEIGFEEDFALATDRTVVLKQLIPGTEDYYYYHCLHFQHTGQFEKVEEMLPLWIKRHKDTNRNREIRHRQALLLYEKQPTKTLNYLTGELRLRFNHERERLDKKSNLPTALAQKLISRETLTQEARAEEVNLSDFEDRALDWLTQMDLNEVELDDLLRRLKRPDYANLPSLVVKDLKYKRSRGFGSKTIHRQLMLSQLDECLKLDPKLLNDSKFVPIYLSKLLPNDDLDWRHDPKEREAYLDRQWAFVKQLVPAHNSLKASVLYHRLVHGRAKGVYDHDRFMEYIKLPRSVGYIRPEYINRREFRDVKVNLRANFQKATCLPPIVTDEPLVRSYLMHFFRDAKSIEPFDTYIRDDYLKPLFAETKIVNDLGDQEQWYSMLSPARYKALKERIDIDFAFTNKQVFGPQEAVGLDLHVKNVEKLIVKVYEINAMNFYRANLKEVDTDINLDGLVANTEDVHTYKEVALRRVKRHFDFDDLKERGVYIVEFIGNGKSSRALIRKGYLRSVSRTSTAGHVVTVLDEAGKTVDDARMWVAGHEYAADEDGKITVPFSNRPGRQTVILSRGQFASLDRLDHEAERYSLTAGIHVDRESLLKRKKTNVAIRPVLSLNGEPVTLSVLEEITLLVTSTDREGVSSTQEVRDFKLFEDRESLHEFSVPDKVVHLGFTLKAKVKNLSQNKKIDLATGAGFALNGIDKSEKVEDLHLGQINGKYVLDVLGKTGEIKPDRPVNMVLKHRDFRETVHISLQTDAAGRIMLGELKDIVSVRATGPEGTSHTWRLAKDSHSYPSVVHGTAGGAIALPYMGSEAKPLRSELSLLETRSGTFLDDRFAALSIAGGMIELKGLPAGDYDLMLKDPGRRIKIRVTKGDLTAGHLVGQSRTLEVRNAKPLQIASVALDDAAVTVKLVNSNPHTRVHVVATRYEPEYPIESDLSVGFPGPVYAMRTKAESVYLSGRNIGDEYRYIIDRRYAKKYPGNMLTRPGLLLNPWAIRKTETGRQTGAKGEAAYGRGGGAGKGGGRAASEAKHFGQMAGFASLDFLSTQGAVVWNLAPDKSGTVTVPRADLGDRQMIHVLAVDPENTAYRRISLAETKPEFSDLRLLAGLDPKVHFTEQKQISFVDAGKQFQLADITSSQCEVYDSLAKVYRLYATLSNDATLAEFAFILNWPKLKAEEKREKYSKYACHELSFFIYRKDPEFFKSVVQPYLKNKKDKTFMDHWLTRTGLSGYLKPWNFARLNIVERALLAQRVDGQGPVMSRHVKDLWDLIPPDIERFNHLFKTALKGSSLEAADALGLRAATDKAAMVDRLRRDPRAIAARPVAPSEAAKAVTFGAKVPQMALPESAPAKERAAGRYKKLAEAKADEARGGVRRKDVNGLLEVGAEREYYAKDLKRRGRARQLYRKLDKTQEWVENNYWHLPIESQAADLIKVNAFWSDYAAHGGKPGFYSTNLAEAHRNFAEMMLALAVLDIPFEAGEHKTDFEDDTMKLTAGSAAVVFHKEIKTAGEAAEKVPVLVSQNFFRHGDRYRHENNEKFEKYVTDEFLVHVVYGCHVVVTNPTSTRQKLDVLLQVPLGAIPVLNGQYTRSIHMSLEPYRTQTVDYYFYFPAAGQAAHYPVHVARNEKVVAWTEAVTLNVVEKLSKVDKTSWDYISQWGSADDVIEYLKTHNLNRTKLSRIAWRMGDAGYFKTILALLDGRHVYDHTLWSYGLKHNVVAVIREYLQHRNSFVRRSGAYIDSPLLLIDPVIRRTYQHMEYSPLVNARAHQLGKKRRIVNGRFYQQYERLMTVLRYRPELDDQDLMSVTYYLLLQDRVEDGLKFFGRVNPEKLAAQIQYDYFRAYTDFYSDEPKVARKVAKKYDDYPVDRWRRAFENVLAQLDEIEGKKAKVIDDESRTEVQTRLADTAATFDFKVEAKEIVLAYQNVSECVINYYLMDIELLFSRQPFVQQFSGQFGYIRPNHTERVKLSGRKKTKTIDLPKQFHSSNVLVEIVAAGQKKSQAYYSNSLAVQVIENYGQVKVTHASGGKPLSKVYVKVYARDMSGTVKFYKDGYTDLRGRFDYTSLNTNELDNVAKFSLLVLSETDGVVVREASPPKQ